ncbi:hypothetical protein C8R46DRAFT_1031016 [Mycena filopes]|nr:hypothetical protein C8R46DRAFT_1031016 [Mycena filopes]
MDHGRLLPSAPMEPGRQGSCSTSVAYSHLFAQSAPLRLRSGAVADLEPLVDWPYIPRSDITGTLPLTGKTFHQFFYPNNWVYVKDLVTKESNIMDLQRPSHGSVTTYDYVLQRLGDIPIGIIILSLPSHDESHRHFPVLLKTARQPLTSVVHPTNKLQNVFFRVLRLCLGAPAPLEGINLAIFAVLVLETGIKPEKVAPMVFNQYLYGRLVPAWWYKES